MLSQKTTLSSLFIL